MELLDRALTFTVGVCLPLLLHWLARKDKKTEAAINNSVESRRLDLAERQFDAEERDRLRAEVRQVYERVEQETTRRLDTENRLSDCSGELQRAHFNELVLGVKLRAAMSRLEHYERILKHEGTDAAAADPDSGR